MAADYLTQLQQEVEQEIMACIGCNDCLIACPLPEKARVTISELNLAVLSPRITASNVEEFVLACTQCQQCVPVCPADLHRADMVLWNKLKVERAQPNRKLSMHVGKRIVPSGWTLDNLATQLINFQLFKGVKPEVLRRMLLGVTLRQFAPNEIVCAEGEFRETLYIVLDGQLEQSVETADGRQTRVLLMQPGQFYGELGVLSDQTEAYTLTATRPSVILEIGRALTQRLMKESESFKKTLSEHYRRRAKWTYARQSQLFSGLPDKALEDLLAKATLQAFKKGEVIYKQGDQPKNLYLLVNGFLRVSRRHNESELVIQYFREGDLFGGSALVMRQSQTTTITANTRAEVVVIPGPAVFDVLRQYPELNTQWMKMVQENERALSKKRQRSPLVKPVLDSTLGVATTRMISLEGLLDQGIIQGHEVLVIDTAICINCDNCVQGCERRHGYARLERRGLQLGNLLFPTACRHCEDPVCLLCSVNGIVRLPDGEITIVSDNCVGCGACADRCPYGNIQMHDRDKRKIGWRDRLTHVRSQIQEEGFSLWNISDYLTPPAQPHTPSTNRVAVKCDLCADYDDYACVQSCPVGAALRIDPDVEFQKLHIGLETHKRGAA